MPRLSLDRLPSGGENAESDGLGLSIIRMFPSPKLSSAIVDWASTRRNESPRHRETECMAFEKRRGFNQNKVRCKKLAPIFASLITNLWRNRIGGNNHPSYTQKFRDSWITRHCFSTFKHYQRFIEEEKRFITSSFPNESFQHDGPGTGDFAFHCFPQDPFHYHDNAECCTGAFLETTKPLQSSQGMTTFPARLWPKRLKASPPTLERVANSQVNGAEKWKRAINGDGITFSPLPSNRLRPIASVIHYDRKGRTRQRAREPRCEHGNSG